MASTTDNWFGRTETEFGIGSYVAAYQNPFLNYLRVKVHFLQTHIKTRAHQLFPCLREVYYTERKVKAYENNPLDLVFEMKDDIALATPLFLCLKQQFSGTYLEQVAAKKRYLNEYFQKHEELMKQLENLQKEADTISIYLAVEYKKEKTLYHLNLMFDENDVLSGLETERERVVFPRSFNWNNHTELPEFDLQEDMETALVCCHWDPTVYSPQNFRDFCSFYGFNTVAVCWIYRLTAQAIRHNLAKICDAETDINHPSGNFTFSEAQLNVKLQGLLSTLNILNHRRSRIYDSLVNFCLIDEISSS